MHKKRHRNVTKKKHEFKNNNSELEKTRIRIHFLLQTDRAQDGGGGGGELARLTRRHTWIWRI